MPAEPSPEELAKIENEFVPPSDIDMLDLCITNAAPVASAQKPKPAAAVVPTLVAAPAPVVEAAPAPAAPAPPVEQEEELYCPPATSPMRSKSLIKNTPPPKMPTPPPAAEQEPAFLPPTEEVRQSVVASDVGNMTLPTMAAKQPDSPSKVQMSEVEQMQMTAAMMMVPEGSMHDPNITMLPADRVPCPDCGRKFHPSRLDSHIRACKKIFIAKRPEFDLTRKRVDEEGIRMISNETKKELEAIKNGEEMKDINAGKWKKKSGGFREAMALMKEVKRCEELGVEFVETKTQEQKDAEDDRVPCPHCKRKFAANVADRHIPKCKESKAKPNRLQRGSNTGGHYGKKKEDANSTLGMGKHKLGYASNIKK